MTNDIISFEDIEEVQVHNDIWLEKAAGVWFARKEGEPRLVLEDWKYEIFMEGDMEYCGYTITTELFSEVQKLVENKEGE